MELPGSSKLIGLFTNLFFYHRFDTSFASAQMNHLGAWVIVTPVIGGLIVGFMGYLGRNGVMAAARLKRLHGTDP